MEIKLPKSWTVIHLEDANNLYEFQKTFPDGIDVIVFIRFKDNKYEILSSIEHRTSGPHENIVGQATSISDALTVVRNKLEEYDQELT